MRQDQVSLQGDTNDENDREETGLASGKSWKS
jgi:hypothetical protein